MDAPARAAPDPESGIETLGAGERRVLEAALRDLPLETRPFAALARRLDSDERLVLTTLGSLHARGVIDRIGPVLEPRACGASTLAAIAVPAGRLAECAAIVNRFPEVNHNYAREHRFNLWFVLTAASRERIDEVLATIGAHSGCAPLDLPMTRAYHVDLGFCTARPTHDPGGPRGGREPLAPDRLGRHLLAACEDGLELVARPYAALAGRLASTEEVVIETLARLLAEGSVKRIGAVVRHRRLGLRANAMAVWAVPAGRLERGGRGLARAPGVTLCYARRPAAPRWPYNLYCMVHARERTEARSRLAEASARAGLAGYPHAVLFSTRCFRQRGARYGWGERHG